MEGFGHREWRSNAMKIECCDVEVPHAVRDDDCFLPRPVVRVSPARAS